MKNSKNRIFEASFLMGLLALFFLMVVSTAKGQSQFEFKSLAEALNSSSEVEKLVLRDQGLTTFPKDILRFQGLKYLDLSKNHIDELPRKI